MPVTHATPIERRLVLAAKLRPADPSPNWALLSRLPRGTDAQRFAAAVEAVLHATPSFRRTFTLTDRGDVLVAPIPGREPVAVVPYDDEDRVRAAATRWGDHVFDPSHAPLHHAEVATVGDEAYLLFAGAHVCSDGFGFYQLVGDFAAHYAEGAFTPSGRVTNVMEVKRTSQDEAVAHFRETFAGVDDLRIDGWDRRDAEGRIPGSITRTPLPPDIYHQSGTLAKELDIRRYSVLVSAVAVAAGCLASASAVTIATPMANRRSGPDSATTRGVRVNTLPLRFDLAPDRTVADLVRATDCQLESLIRHEQHAFSDFSRSVFRGQSMDSTQPSVSFTLYPRPLSVVVDGVRGESIGVNRRYLQYPLTVAVEVTPRVGSEDDRSRGDQVTLIVERADFLPDCDIAGLVTHVLRQMTVSHGAVVLRTIDWAPSDGLTSFVAVRQRFPRRPLTEDVAAMVAQHPDAVAVVTDERQVTYRELNSMANAVARWLRGHSDASAMVVAIEPSVELVVTILGLFRAGVGYIPVDGTSTTRVAQVSEICNHPPILVAPGNPAGLTSDRVLELPATVTNASALGRVLSTMSPATTSVPTADATAYTLFTSGTTGTPKGVMITHAAAARFFDGLHQEIGSGQRRWLHSHSPSFDISLVEMLGALTSGGAVCIPRSGARRDPRYLGDFIRRHDVQILSQTPSAFTLLAPHLAHANSLAVVLFCGERLERSALTDFLRARPDVRVMNCYGTTETTMYHTAHRVTVDDTAVPPLVGAPFPDVSMAVVDESLRPVPPGVSGEIVVGGDGLMQGYVGDPDLTARRMVSLAGAPVYLTGDRGTMTADGAFSVTGRMDAQVKIRGHRCELGEVENAVYSTGLVHAVHAAVVGSGLTGRLVCFVVLVDGADHGALLPALRPLLPRYFEPDLIVTLDALPMTVNGKVDTARLVRDVQDLDAQPSQGSSTTAVRTAGDAPSAGGDVDDAVRQVWAEVLGTESFTPTTNFFDAGGTSAMVLQVGDRLRERFGVQGIDVVDLFEHHTPTDLARLVRERMEVTAE